MLIEQLDGKSELLIEYAKSHDIYTLTSEDILKLLETPYIISEILTAFNISEKEFAQLRKEKGITNMYLENCVRNIDVVLYYFDNCGKYFSDKIRDKMISILVSVISSAYPKHNFYREKLLELDFSIKNVEKEINVKNIDVPYRLDIMQDIVNEIKDKIDVLIEQEKAFILNYNNDQMYNTLMQNIKNGKRYTKDDLTKEILYELAIIENKSDSLIGDIFNLTKNQVRNIRIKMGLNNKFKTKMVDHPEGLMYYIENHGYRNKNVSNLEYMELIDKCISDRYNIKSSIEDEQTIENEQFIININNKEYKYNVTFSKELYSVKQSPSSSKSNGRHNNYKKTNEKKLENGKLGERIVEELEKQKLQKMGLSYLTEEVKLVAQIDEEITFDGLGYDIISYNELGEKILIEVKTNIGNKDKPFFISKKEIELMKGFNSEYDCKQCFIYYVLIKDSDVKIKKIDCDRFSQYKLDPILYKIIDTN